MPKRIILMLSIVVCLLLVSVPEIYADGENIITVEIDYNNVISSKTVDILYEDSMSALGALQKVTAVETHPVGKHVIVSAIDGIKGERGKMAWYYYINDKKAEKIAFGNILDKDVKRIKWVYKEDVCSKTVDGDME